ncbi:MAG: hypothetical protein LGB54_03690 [Sulfurovum sp.]|nr:hypothetical protein [Sulfurovum sp.]
MIYTLKGVSFVEENLTKLVYNTYQFNLKRKGFSHLEIVDIVGTKP